MTELREKDVTVLQAIQDGATTTSQIREATTLTTREVNYSLTEYSLEDLDLVQINRSEGREWQEINGHQKNTWKAKRVQLTDKGIQTLAEHDTSERYKDMSQQELIEQVHELEQRLDRMETVFKDFRGKVIEQI